MSNDSCTTKSGYCRGACLGGQPHKHGYVCRFCRSHVSSDLQQFKWGPAIRHFKNHKCKLPPSELELFCSAVTVLDTQYIESYQRAEERHAERYAASRSKKSSTRSTASKKAAAKPPVRAGEEDFVLPPSARKASASHARTQTERAPRLRRAPPAHVRAKMLLDEAASQGSASPKYAESINSSLSADDLGQEDGSP